MALKQPVTTEPLKLGGFATRPLGLGLTGQVRLQYQGRWYDQEPELAMALDCLLLAPLDQQERVWQAMRAWISKASNGLQSALPQEFNPQRRHLDRLPGWQEAQGQLRLLSPWHHRQAGRFLLAQLASTPVAL